MASLAEIRILDVPYQADRAYTYYVPVTLEDTLAVGMAASVPFGRGNRLSTGIVTKLYDADIEEGTKPVETPLGDAPVLDEELIGLCLFMKEYTLCTFGDAVRAVVPPAAMGKVVSYYRVNPEIAGSEAARRSVIAADGERGALVYDKVREKARVTKQAMQTELGFDCSKALAALVETGALEKKTEIRSPSQTPTRCFLIPDGVLASVSYPSDGGEWEAAARGLRGRNQQKLFSAFRAACAAGEETELGALADAAGIDRAAAKRAAEAFQRAGLLTLTEEDAYRNPFAVDADSHDAQAEEKPVLTEEQTAAFDAIAELIDAGEPGAALLHGVTGSGKTNVILAAIDRTLEGGRGVIMLVPEIALTPQTVGIFERRYGGRIAVIHSGLSAGERFDAWRRIREGLADVVVGTRSAIFAPIPKIGLIVIDEEQEYTYKSDANPKYHAHDVARWRCREHGAVMLLSSATPSVTSYYKAQTGAYRLVTLKKRYGGAKLPNVQIYDMRGEVAAGNLSPIGGLLAERLRADRAAGNQSILFLNRRGYHNYVSCRSCGVSVKCPNCSVTLVYHALRTRMGGPGKKDEGYEENRRENGMLVCHFCGHRERVPAVCPACGKDHFLFMGVGTQKAEDDILSAFPDLRVLRMDADSTQTKFSHEEILSRFRKGEADVLLGTQMVTKGHDFPRVATVGVLNADSSLFLDDYRAAERTFAMLTQVIGRAGRADVPGTAVIQTYNPSNEVIRLAASQDYETFYAGEIKLRKALCFPPFCDIAVITLQSADEASLGLMTTQMSERIVKHIRKDFSDIPLILYGPFEATVYRIQNICRMRFVLKCRLNRRTRAFLSDLMTEFARSTPSKGGKRVTISVDLNPSTV